MGQSIVGLENYYENEGYSFLQSNNRLTHIAASFVCKYAVGPSASSLSKSFAFWSLGHHGALGEPTSCLEGHISISTEMPYVCIGVEFDDEDGGSYDSRHYCF